MQITHLESISKAVVIKLKCKLKRTRPRGYKTFFMLNSAEHEI